MWLGYLKPMEVSHRASRDFANGRRPKPLVLVEVSKEISDRAGTARHWCPANPGSISYVLLRICFICGSRVRWLALPSPLLQLIVFKKRQIRVWYKRKFIILWGGERGCFKHPCGLVGAPFCKDCRKISKGNPSGSGLSEGRPPSLCWPHWMNNYKRPLSPLNYPIKFVWGWH